MRQLLRAVGGCWKRERGATVPLEFVGKAAVFHLNERSVKSYSRPEAEKSGLHILEDGGKRLGTCEQGKRNNPSCGRGAVFGAGTREI